MKTHPAVPSIMLSLALVTACGSQPLPPVARESGSEAPKLVSLVFEQTSKPVPSGGVGVENDGDADVRISFAHVNGGRLRAVRGPDGGVALEFPSFQQAERAPAAVLGVWNAFETDQLSPGNASFSFGAGFQLDALSSGRPSDNGDNLMQRGFYAEPMQYKIQVDKRVPSCRVQGAKGAVFVKADFKVDDSSWYHVECSRSGDRLTLRVGLLTSRSSVTDVREFIARGETGEIKMSDPAQPMTVGGKLNRDGTVADSSVDQFNGRVAHVFYTVE